MKLAWKLPFWPETELVIGYFNLKLLAIRIDMNIGTLMDLCFDGYSEASGGVWQLLGHMANARLAKHYHQQSEEEEADPGCDEGQRLNVVVQDVPGGGRCGECGEEETVGHGGGEEGIV